MVSAVREHDPSTDGASEDAGSDGPAARRGHPRGARVAIRDLSIWRSAGDEAPVVRDLSMTIEPGERLVLAGPNGAGKTSLLLALVGAVRSQGSIWVDDVELSRRTLKQIRSRVGLVFADPSEQLFCDTAWNEVAFGPRQRGASETEVAERTRWALDAVGATQLAERSPHALSLGEQRRLAMAAVLACRHDVVLVDEPTSGLDPVARQRVLAALDQTAATLVLATHDLDAAERLNTRLVLMNVGAIVAQGEARDLATSRDTLLRAGLAV